MCLFKPCVYVNRKDCGVFVIKLMETWRADVDTRSIFSYQDILNIRIQYANRLYFHAKNQVDQSFVTEFYASVNFCPVAFSAVSFLPTIFHEEIHGDCSLYSPFLYLTGMNTIAVAAKG